MTGARVLVMDAADNVALCLSDLAAGEAVEGGLSAREAIPAGHKIARAPIDRGAAVVKYGQTIGRAERDIAAGEHVHVHNVSAEVEAGGRAEAAPARRRPARQAGFEGYVRADGRAATRNYVGILSSVNCSATVVRAIADGFPDRMFGNRGDFDGVVALTHTTGCGIPAGGEAAAILDRVMEGYAAHPNFGGLLVVGLGCEVNQVGRVGAREGGPPLRTMTIQEEGGTRRAIERGTRLVEELIEEAGGAVRETLPASQLTLGLQCGGSDGWSGITANPALGRAADMLVAAGGTVILSETPEIYGAEQLLLGRAAEEGVAERLRARLDWWRDYVARHGASLDNNPSPGNIEGGITTILEKSLGAVAKSGSSPLTGVYEYGEPVDRSGFVFMDSPGYDPCSATGQMAAGANILAFTTGRGSVFGSKPAPCIKLASNREMAARMDEDMDIDASPVLEGVSIDEMGERIFQRLLTVASGERSKSEALGLGQLEFVPWQLGAVM